MARFARPNESGASSIELPTIYSLKPAFQDALRPITAVLARWGVSANMVTVTALSMSLLAGAWLANQLSVGGANASLLLLAPVLIVRMGLNAMDGMLAREHGMETPLGALLNELGDVISDAALYLPLALLPGVWAPLQVMVVLLGCFTEMTGVLGTQLGAGRRYDGPMGKADRALTFGALTTLLGLGMASGTWLNVVLGMVSLLLVVTVCNRARMAVKEAV